MQRQVTVEGIFHTGQTITEGWANAYPMDDYHVVGEVYLSRSDAIKTGSKPGWRIHVIPKTCPKSGEVWQ